MGTATDFVRLHSAALRALNDVRHSPGSDREEPIRQAKAAVDGFLEIWDASDTHPLPHGTGEALRDAQEALSEGDATEAWQILLDVGRSLDEHFRG